jgi:hypothetical protein
MAAGRQPVSDLVHYGFLIHLVELVNRERQPQVFTREIRDHAGEATSGFLYLILGASDRCHGALLRFVARPVAPSKHARIDFATESSAVVGCKNTTTSSAFKEILYGTAFRFKGLNKLLSSALENMEFRASMTITNNSGDNGSPCLRPRA